MLLARVLRPIVATQKDASLKGRKLLLVEVTDTDGNPKGPSFIAVDNENTHAGVGDFVLIAREGTGCRQMMGDNDAPINAMICGVVDQIHLN